ncbi:right-handed parallel beta-helix repeat-containing protein [Actinomadura sp. NAK00032]|uniref:right-handed parallel beta-helix repeat-containing protein n=1 Tax=Actinomadura sp. NAK00032 TaxID=2742128 RepID=UPI001591C0C6|nr:right-handed parallel beta-helix repeat-containing protein [Actinomadura sp. NAK00032]QKW37790.1 right-handed parallel beta-helix repeat-containing protein [Actinomadura sp. NAK00032]
MRQIFAASVGAAVVLAGLASPAAAGQADGRTTGRTHVVPPGHSIQRAVDRARPGDTIRLKAGYYEGGVLVRKRLTIRGEGNKTILRPGRHDHCAKAKAPGMGICVIGRSKHPVKGVTIRNLTVHGFKGSGVHGMYTDRLTVLAVLAKKNGEYGIAEYRSTRGQFVWNWTLDNSADAGLYVGDITNAHGTEVAHNHTSGNTLGVLVRHAHHVDVHDNEITRNCVGVALVDDGQKGGQGHNKVWKNKVAKNNRSCAAHGPVPPFGGTGVLLFGGEHNTIAKNIVKDNRGRLPYSGGIVLFPGVAPEHGSARPARFNLIQANRAFRNRPYDLVNKSGSKTNRFRHNKCRTSNPRGLC